MPIKPVKHFTATTYLFVEETNKTIMVWHPSLKSWLPPGGHIEQNETPEDTARREIQEEVGTSIIEFISRKSFQDNLIDNRAKLLLMPYFLFEEEIEENHFHMDWIYFAIVPSIEYVSPEGLILKLFTKNELELEKDMFKNVRELAFYGFNLMNKLN